MDFIYLNCKNCGATIQFEPGRQRAFCSSCGTQIFSDEVYVKDSIESLVSRAEGHLKQGNISSAQKAYDEIAELHPYVHYGWEGKLLCRTNSYKSPLKTGDIPWLIELMKHIVQSAPVETFNRIKESYSNYIFSNLHTLVNQQKTMVESIKAATQRQIEQERNNFSVCEDILKKNHAVYKSNYKSVKKSGYKIPILIKILCILIFTISAPLCPFILFFVSTPNWYELKYITLAIAVVISIITGIFGLKGWHKPKKKVYKEKLKLAQENISNTEKDLEARRTEFNRIIDNYNKKIEACDKYNNTEEYSLNSHMQNKFMQFESNHDLDASLSELERIIGIS